MASVNTAASLDGLDLVRWDFVKGVTEWRLWAFLGLQDIKQRYRRSLLGPLWLTLGLGATVLGVGLLYSEILKTASGTYVPYIAISLLIWNLVSQVITESTTIFQGSGHVIASVKIPYTSFILRALVRNLIVACHSVIVVVIAFAWYRYPVTLTAFASIGGLVLVCANLYWIALLVSIVSARYRDVAQIINYTVAIFLFLTPVIWQPSAIRPGNLFMRLNPFAQLLQVVRAPIFDHAIPLYSFSYCCVLLIVGMTVTTIVFAKSRKSLVHWI